MNPFFLPHVKHPLICNNVQYTRKWPSSKALPSLFQVKVKKSSSDGFQSTDIRKSERQCDTLKSYDQDDQDLSHVFTCWPILSGKFVLIRKMNSTGELQLEINEVVVYHKGNE